MEQTNAPPANLAKGDDPHGVGLAAGLSEIELAFWLGLRPAVHRACRPFDRDAQATREDRCLLGVLGLRGRRVVSRRCGGDGESEAPATRAAAAILKIGLLTIGLNILSPIHPLDERMDNARPG